MGAAACPGNNGARPRRKPGGNAPPAGREPRRGPPPGPGAGPRAAPEPGHAPRPPRGTRHARHRATGPGRRAHRRQATTCPPRTVRPGPGVPPGTAARYGPYGAAQPAARGARARPRPDRAGPGELTGGRVRHARPGPGATRSGGVTAERGTGTRLGGGNSRTPDPPRPGCRARPGVDAQRSGPAVMAGPDRYRVRSVLIPRVALWLPGVGILFVLPGERFRFRFRREFFG